MGDLVFPQQGPGLTQIRASLRVVGAPSPRPDPGPWLRPIVANIYICRVNSQEGAGLGRGGLWSLDPADLGGGFWRKKPLGQKVRGGAQGHPQLLTPSQLRGGFKPRALPPSPSCCVDRQPLLPGPQCSREEHKTLGSGGGRCGATRLESADGAGPVEVRVQW